MKKKKKKEKKKKKKERKKRKEKKNSKNQNVSSKEISLKGSHERSSCPHLQIRQLSTFL